MNTSCGLKRKRATQCIYVRKRTLSQLIKPLEIMYEPSGLHWNIKTNSLFGSSEQEKTSKALTETAKSIFTVTELESYTKEL